MNWDQIKGNWKQFKGQAQQQWGKLTDDDLDVAQGRRTELAGRIQERYGDTREAAEQAVDTWANSLESDVRTGEKLTSGQKRNM